MLSGCLKSPISRIGGKNYLVSWLCRYIPVHVCYVEPFAGGAKLLFKKKVAKIEVLNDVDDSLVNLYRCIQNNEKRSRLITLLNETPYSRSVFQAWKYDESTPLDDIEKAARYFYLCKTSFAGDVVRGGFACPSVTGRNPAQSFQNAIDGLEGIAGRMRGVTIENLNYQECIRRYDSPDTLFYCDPPYLDAGHYYSKDFTHEDHHQLSEVLHDVKGKVMLSHYQCGLYDRLYSGWQRFEYSSFKGSKKVDIGGEKPKIVEVLYCNFKPTGRNKSLF